MLSLAFPIEPVEIHVRWTLAATDAQRHELESRFQLRDGSRRDGTTWTYSLTDASTGNIEALVHDALVQDTDGVDRNRYRPVPEISWMRQHRLLGLFAGSAVLGSILFLALPGLIVILTAACRSIARMPSWLWADFTAAPWSNASAVPVSPHNPRVTATVLLTGVLISAAMASFAGAAFLSAAGALAILYISGYLVGALLMARAERLSSAIIRTVAGLMLSSIGYLIALVLTLPWFLVPTALVMVTLVVRGRSAFAWPPISARVGWDGMAAGILAAVLLSPIGITFFLMAPGPFPPVFYDVDTAYSLDIVHATVKATAFPPPSLGNLGVMRTYHYGTHAMAALIARGSGLLPHHALFLVVLPLLAIGVIAAAVAVTQQLAPALPRVLTVPLLLLSTPLLTRTFSDGFGPALWTAVTSGPFTFDWIVHDYNVWGILSNEAQNVASDFLILGSIVSVAAAPMGGWLLPAFLIGSSVIFKTTAGIALVSGFMLAEGWQAIASKRYRPSAQMVMAGAIFAATYAAFFLASFDSAFRVQLYPLEHIRTILGPHALVTVRGALFDSLWLFLPVLIVLGAKVRDAETPRTSLLLMAVAPLLVVNTTRLVHVSQGGEGAGLDWVQIPHSVPFLVHAFALSLAGRGWRHFGLPRRVAFLVALALAVAPVTIAAGRYSSGLLQDRTRGNEFVDNRSLAEALAVIPVDSSLIVTNDLRYPADNFGREDRQMQLPALFGHQAFSTNFSYEPIEDRRALQQLIQRPEWSDAIAAAARRYHWTHLVIHKAYVHPSPIPLTRIFENDAYSVYRFP